jgi:hypothetical protein
MKLITDEACASLTNQVSGYLTEIGHPISIQSRHLVYAVEQAGSSGRAESARAAGSISCIGTPWPSPGAFVSFWCD